MGQMGFGAALWGDYGGLNSITRLGLLVLYRSQVLGPLTSEAGFFLSPYLTRVSQNGLGCGTQDLGLGNSLRWPGE